MRYEAGYLRRFVFELDERGQVIRGGMLELAGKDSEFLLQNEVLLVEGFLVGVKSKDLTYLWSDFVSRPLDGTQADGRVVALQREGGGSLAWMLKRYEQNFASTGIGCIVSMGWSCLRSIAILLAARRAVIPQELLMPKMPAWMMELGEGVHQLVQRELI